MTLTIEQARDRLAKLLGWEFQRDAGGGGYWHHPVKGYRSPWRDGTPHPVPLTLDGLAALWPEGWWFTSAFDAKGEWLVIAGKYPHPPIDTTGPTEYEARLRLLLAVLEHIKENT